MALSRPEAEDCLGREAVWKQADWHALMIHRDGVQTESVV
jgi:hypothetical protein